MPDIRGYNRPNQQWECGWKKRGFSCHVGPSSNGKCPGKGECEPIKKEDGYHCTRLPEYGGKCSKGPLPDGKCSRQYPPCSPKRSLRARRKLTSIGVVAVALALIYINLGGAFKTSSHFFSPGPLSSNHSSIMNECSSCHSEAHGKPIKWFFGDSNGDASKNCLGCHSMGDHSMNPHSLAASALQPMTEELIAAGGMAGGKKQLACTTCHKEHRGEKFDLTALTDKQCQTCHAKTFERFSVDHPDFKDYPFRERVNILFNHTSHFSQHFEKKNRKDISCQNCHAPSSSGNKMVLNGFETSCASCHADQIHGTTALNKGIVFFRVPALDLESLGAKGMHVGRWPEEADGEITPFTKMLLMQDEDVAEALEALLEDEVELDDLEDAEKETLQNVRTVAWGIKRLLNTLVTEGLDDIEEKLAAASEVDEMSLNELASLTGALPIDVVRGAMKSWFGNVNSELESVDGGWYPRNRAVSPKEDDEVDDEDAMKTGGWYRSNEEFVIRYRPKGHADGFLKGWTGFSAKLAKPDTVAAEVFEILSQRKGTPGACAKCHGVEKEKEAYLVNWFGTQEKAGQQNFVRFSHSSHLNLIKEKGCYTCHSTNEEADFEKAFDGHDATVFESNFHPIDKSKCMQCHQGGRVSDSCTTCHNYHIGDFFTSESRMKEIKTDLSNGEEADKKEEKSDKE